MADFEIKGLGEVQKNLEELADNIAHNALRKAVQAGVNVLGEEVMARTPVDTGLLKESVGTAVRRKGDAVLGAVGFGKKDHIARWIEFGHRIIGHKPHKKDTGKHVPARPFIRPAFDASKDKAVEAFTDVLTEEVAKHTNNK